MKVFTLDLPTLKLGAARRTFANRRWMSVRPMIFQSSVHPTRESMYLSAHPSHNSGTQIQCPRGRKPRFSTCTSCAERACRSPCSPRTTSPPHVRSIPMALTLPSSATRSRKSVSDYPPPPDSPSMRCCTIPEPSRAAPRILSSSPTCPSDRTRPPQRTPYAPPCAWSRTATWRPSSSRADSRSPRRSAASRKSGCP